MRTHLTLAVLALLLALLAISAPAAADSPAASVPPQEHVGHHGMPHNAFAEVMAKMHQNMAAPASGNLDIDFIKGMIPHHQGAIDMAQIALEGSSDPFIRQLAQEVIAAQTKEIAAMQAWLAQHEPR